MKVYLVKSVNEETLEYGVLNLRVFTEEKDAEKFVKSIERKMTTDELHSNSLLIEEFDVYKGK